MFLGKTDCFARKNSFLGSFVFWSEFSKNFFFLYECVRKIVEKKEISHISASKLCTQHGRKCTSIELLQLRFAYFLANTHKRLLPERIKRTKRT
ncbi:MAG TPA: hypothetical protein DHV12_05815 [Thermotogae bacterium]|nr:hypothetical protein [Thermotogota bacterium]